MEKKKLRRPTKQSKNDFVVDYESSKKDHRRSFCRLTWPHRPEWFMEGWIHHSTKLNKEFFRRGLLSILNRVAKDGGDLRFTETRFIDALMSAIEDDSQETPSLFLRLSTQLPSTEAGPPLKCIQEELGRFVLNRSRLPEIFYGPQGKHTKGVMWTSARQLIEESRKNTQRINQPKVHKRHNRPTQKEAAWVLKQTSLQRKNDPSIPLRKLAELVKVDYDNEVEDTSNTMRSVPFRPRSLQTIKEIIQAPKKHLSR